eukprot:TRINITY_DN4711_c0_g1_i1.p1 TRINITY_DN4711_c0_g1~~TRINITY_DN4711_c0_g1_i1.p1  ORF type:complete len:939 (+),score=157.20 TRINITY_DN4711_c0_g1_i1:118-2934(+)
MALSLSEPNFSDNRNAWMKRFCGLVGVVGVDNILSLAKLKTLVIGAKGVGVEVAKNLILMGTQSVVIRDNGLVSIADLGTNFCLTSTSIGQKRSIASLPYLRSLSEYCDVSADQGDSFTEDLLNTFHAVVVTNDTPLKELDNINKICRQIHEKNMKNHPIFVLAQTHGVVVNIFTDFGKSHEIIDSDGEEPCVGYIKEVEIKEKEEESGVKSKYLLITLTDQSSKFFEDDTLVKITDLVELDEVNNTTFKVKKFYHRQNRNGKLVQLLVKEKLIVEADQVYLEQWSKYRFGGILTEIKTKTVKKFLPLSESMLFPVDTDQYKLLNHPHIVRKFEGRGNLLHIAQLSLWEYQEKYSKLPELHNESDADELISIATVIYKKFKDDNVLDLESSDTSVLQEVVKKVSFYCKSELPALTSVTGGIASHEVLKLTGLFSPIHQWLHIDFFDLIIGGRDIDNDLRPLGTRYDHEISIFGRKYVDELHRKTVALLGSGSIGNEVLKCLSLMGLSTSNDGSKSTKSYIIDHALVSEHNKSNHFLLSKGSNGKYKSREVEINIKSISPDMRISSIQESLNLDSSLYRNDVFWKNIDVIINATDTVKSKLLSDDLSIMHSKPMITAGLLGSKCNSDVTIPHKTQAYQEIPVTEDNQMLPKSTYNFPESIDHCITYADSYFNDMFIQKLHNFNQFLQIKDNLKTDNIDECLPKYSYDLDHFINILNYQTKEVTYETCVKMAFDEFTRVFRDKILHIIHSFPKDYKQSLYGVDPQYCQYFWYGSRRYPKPIEFDKNNNDHVTLLHRFSNIFAYIYNVPVVSKYDEYKELLEKLSLSADPFVVPNNSDDEDVKKKNMIRDLFKNNNKKFKALLPLDTIPNFIVNNDKEEVYNLTEIQIDFVYLFANLRGSGYSLSPSTRYNCMKHVTKLKPSIVTTSVKINYTVKSTTRIV